MVEQKPVTLVTETGFSTRVVQDNHVLRLYRESFLALEEFFNSRSKRLLISKIFYSFRENFYDQSTSQQIAIMNKLSHFFNEAFAESGHEETVTFDIKRMTKIHQLKSANSYYDLTGLNDIFYFILKAFVKYFSFENDMEEKRFNDFLFSKDPKAKVPKALKRYFDPHQEPASGNMIFDLFFKELTTY